MGLFLLNDGLVPNAIVVVDVDGRQVLTPLHPHLVLSLHVHAQVHPSLILPRGYSLLHTLTVLSPLSLHGFLRSFTVISRKTTQILHGSGQVHSTDDLGVCLAIGKNYILGHGLGRSLNGL
jgi:hypothetical protein